MLRVFVRADAGTQIGTGHVMRCLTLARALRDTLNATVTFICRDFDGHLIDLLRAQQMDVAVLPMATAPEHTGDSHDYRSWLGADWREDAQDTLTAIRQRAAGSDTCLLITDHYAINRDWHERVRPAVDKIVAIDDLANRLLDCDLLLDTTYGRRNDEYAHLTPAHCQPLTGSQFALLRHEFYRPDTDIAALRRQRTTRNRVLVMMGGADPHNATCQALACLRDRTDLDVTAVVGATMPHWQAVQAECTAHAHMTFLRAPDGIAELMLVHDIAIAAAGTTSWERCASGLPSLLVVQAQNQVHLCNMIANAGAAVALDLPLSAATIQSGINHWQQDEQAYHDAVAACLHICDGAGTARVVAAIRTLALPASPSA